MKHTLTALDLFSGAGGFTLGMESAGIHSVGAIEADKFAASTYTNNFPRTKIHQRKMEDCSNQWIRRNFSGVDVVFGGPPCQGFSVAGPTQYGVVDPRNGLILEMARVVKILRPRLVVMENVPTILSGKLADGHRAVDIYRQQLENAGYFSKAFILQAADFGVPQMRQRVFLISALSSDDIPTGFAKRFGNSIRPWRSASDGISDLPKLEQGEAYGDRGSYTSAPKNEFQRSARKNSVGVSNHVAMKNSERIVERILALKPGDSLKDVAPQHGQRQRNHHRLDGQGKRYKMNYTRLHKNSPSISVTANFQTIHVHPVQHRMLTAREGARLQSFPDSFVFVGPRTLPSKKLLEREGRQEEIGLSQYNQIGNAVPPLLARAVGLEIVRKLCGS